MRALLTVPWPDLTDWFIMVVVIGFGLGRDRAVAQALISEVLSSAQ